MNITTNHPLEQEAERYVTSFFDNHGHEQLLYHNLAHTRMVVLHAAEMAAWYRLGQDEMDIVLLAAWFHDTGHLTGPPEGHEARSMEICRDFLRTQPPMPPDKENRIMSCILATKMPHAPQGLLQEIICDADTFHFGTEEFRATNKAVKEELIQRQGKNAVAGWTEQTCDLLEQHTFFTSYATQLLEAGKQENIGWLKKKLQKQNKKKKKKDKKTEEITETPDTHKTQMKVTLQQQKMQHSLLARGVQTVLRIASENHMELSRMADTKAHLLISVNAIIISVTIGVLVRKIDVEPYLTAPTMIFLASSVVTIVLSIFATQPKITKGEFTREDIVNRRTNLLFFGNFHKATFEDYDWAMNYMIRDRDYLYGSVIKDIYFLGQVLHTKYRYIRAAYIVFTIGIIVSVIAFVTAVLLFAPEQQTVIINGAGAPI